MDVRLSARLGLVADAKGLTNTQADAEGMGVFNEPREAWRKGST